MYQVLNAYKIGYNTNALHLTCLMYNNRLVDIVKIRLYTTGTMSITSKPALCLKSEHLHVYFTSLHFSQNCFFSNMVDMNLKFYLTNLLQISYHLSLCNILSALPFLYQYYFLIFFNLKL